MKRHKSLYTLSHDHHHGLILAQLIKRSAPKYKNLPDTIEGKKDYTISFYKKELTNHFNEEENILLPAVKGKEKELDKLFAELIEEHKTIKDLVHQLEENKDVELNLDNLGNLLTAHIRKEERRLFPMIENCLTGAELNYLSEKLQRK